MVLIGVDNTLKSSNCSTIKSTFIGYLYEDVLVSSYDTEASASNLRTGIAAQKIGVIYLTKGNNSKFSAIVFSISSDYSRLSKIQPQMARSRSENGVKRRVTKDPYSLT